MIEKLEKTEYEDIIQAINKVTEEINTVLNDCIRERYFEEITIDLIDFELYKEINYVTNTVSKYQCPVNIQCRKLLYSECNEDPALS
jgi:hypothetical protein